LWLLSNLSPSFPPPHTSYLHTSDADKSALAVAFAYVAHTRRQTAVAASTVDVNHDGIRDEKDEESEMMELGEMERDLMANKMFEEFVTPEEELKRLLERVQRSMHDRYMESSVPVWRRTFFDGSDSKEHQASIRAIQHQLKINPDGSLAPLTFRETLTYGNRQNMLVKRIERARREGRQVKDELDEVEVPDESLKDIVLIRQFILSRVNPIIRLSLRQAFEEIEGLPPEPIHPVVWMVGWFLITGLSSFFIY
jgi:hypothetical protein